MVNIGKIFEQQIKKSIPDYILLYRLPDSAESFNRSSTLRFSRKNPFDYIMWDSNAKVLYALELKTVKGKSISFERDVCDKGEIHIHQINGLREWDKYDGVICGFIIEFRELEKTIFLTINDFDRLISIIQKKSFNFDDLNKNEIQYIIIPQTKQKKYFLYDIKEMLCAKH